MTQNIQFRKYECEEYYFDYFHAMRVILLPTTIIFAFNNPKYDFILENIEKSLIKDEKNIGYFMNKLQEKGYGCKRFHRESIEYFMEHYFL